MSETTEPKTLTYRDSEMVASLIKQGKSADQIAIELRAKGYISGRGMRLTPVRVRSFIWNNSQRRKLMPSLVSRRAVATSVPLTRSTQILNAIGVVLTGTASDQAKIDTINVLLG